MTVTIDKPPAKENTTNRVMENGALLSALFQSVEEGILVVNLNGVVENYNNQFTRLWQIPQHIIESRDDNKLLEHILVQLISPGQFIETVEKLYNSHAEQRDLIRFIDGRTLERYTRPLMVDGEMQGRLWAFRDITDTINRENELTRHREHLTDLVDAKTRELEEMRDSAIAATKTKSAFLANMSHELRTPLNSILGFTGIIKESQAGPVNDEQKTQLNIVFDSATQLLELINNLLDISKIEAGKTVVAKETVNVPDMAYRLSALLGPQANSKGLVILVEPPEEGFDIIHTDSNLLRQILINLMGNAIKFTRRGNITLSWKRLDDRLVEFSVADTGIGIEAGSLKTVFDVFQQVDNPDADNSQGSGLGLAICQQNLQLLEGNIVAESQPGHGSTFKFTLPFGTD